MISIEEKLRRIRAYFESYGGTLRTKMHAIFLLNLVNDLMEERNRLREEISELHEELCWHEEDEEEDGY